MLENGSEAIKHRENDDVGFETPKTKKRYSPPEDSNGYSPTSRIRRSYEAGGMPIEHQYLLDSVKRILNRDVGEGATEGCIKLKDVLEDSGFFRASALNMLRHMENYGILECHRHHDRLKGWSMYFHILRDPTEAKGYSGSH